MAGYSKTPLPQKLGLKPSHRVALLDAPKGFEAELGELPADMKVSRRLSSRGKVDIILFFVTRQADLERRFSRCAQGIVPNGAVWVSWPKRASGVATDVSENSVREVALAAGLVDNKVCAIDETWSGLRCVIRLEDRASR